MAGSEAESPAGFGRPTGFDTALGSTRHLDDDRCSPPRLSVAPVDQPPAGGQVKDRAGQTRAIDRPLPLPAGARLLHIGLMKTGTTAIQHAASSRRSLLRQAGVCYPGSRYNHRQAALARLGRPDDQPVEDAWAVLLREIDAEPVSRIWISNEFICGADDATATGFLNDLGPRTHVVVTLRRVAEVWPSVWQQEVKTGTRVCLEAWLAAVLADPPDPAALPPLFARHNQGAVVARWSRVAGPERVSVLVADKTQPRRVEEAFEGLLDLPSGILDTSGQRGHQTNRSLSAPEAALFRRVNELLQPGQMNLDELTRVLRRGAIARVLDAHEPPGSADTITLPSWAWDGAARTGARYAEEIAATGVRVIGDLAELSRAPQTEGRCTLPDTVPVEVAAQAVLGAMSAGLYRGPDFGPLRPPAAPATGVQSADDWAFALPVRRRVRSVRRWLGDAWRRRIGGPVRRSS